MRHNRTTAMTKTATTMTIIATPGQKYQSGGGLRVGSDSLNSSQNSLMAVRIISHSRRG